MILGERGRNQCHLKGETNVTILNKKKKPKIILGPKKTPRKIVKQDKPPPEPFEANVLMGTPLKNVRHERYVQLRLKCKSKKDAYLGAGYSTNPRSVRGNAHKLEAHPDIAERISMLGSYQSELWMDEYLRDIRSYRDHRC